MKIKKDFILVSFLQLITFSCTNTIVESNLNNQPVKTEKEVLPSLQTSTIPSNISNPLKEDLKKIKTVEISQKNITLESGKNISLNAIVTLETGEKNSAVEWVSGDNSIVSVNSSGKVNALKRGTVTIRAISLQDNKTYDECIISVIDVDSDKATVAQISNPSNKNTFFEKETLKLSGLVKYANGSFDSDLIWKSSDESIAFVSNEGLVTALKGGSVTITCISKKDNNIFDNYELTILPKENKLYVQDLKIVQKNSNIRIGKNFKFDAIVTMSDGTTNSELTWSTSNKDIATVNNFGLVTPVDIGSVNLTATSIKDSTKKVTINVNIMENITWFVNDDSTGNNSGNDWKNAAKSIESILEFVESGDQIWLASGNYKSKNLTVLKSGIKIYGGFSGNESNIDDRNFTDETVLTRFSNKIISLENLSNIILDGLTIKAGITSTDDGAGMSIKNGNNIKLYNIKFIDNITKYTAGGLFIINSNNISITNSYFYNNRSGEGGGAVGMRDSSNISIINSEMENNTTENGKGIIWDLNSSPVLTNITFKNNNIGSGENIVSEGNSNPIIN